MPNLATILVGLVVFGAFGAVIIRGIHNKRHGKGGCSCGCSGCPSSGSCRMKK